LNLSVSVGIATFSPNTNLSLQELLNKADKNLYDKRRKEKNGRGERI
ncbi:MAG: diguanylate cyclase, partial [Syntrophaceae bacterium]|nr:diguanylate cyclase [Syntrophaceae bacterium]